MNIQIDTDSHRIMFQTKKHEEHNTKSEYCVLIYNYIGLKHYSSLKSYFFQVAWMPKEDVLVEFRWFPLIKG